MNPDFGTVHLHLGRLKLTGIHFRVSSGFGFVALMGVALLPAAVSTGISSDSQRPFAIVIVGGLISRLALSIFLAPVLYSLVAKQDDVLKV